MIAEPRDPEVRGLLAKAYGLLARRAYSKGELASRLARLGAAPETLEQALDFLEARHYIDDVRFAREASETLGERRGWGKGKVAQWLRQRGVARELIADPPVEEEASRARQLADKMRARGKNSQQIYRFLCARGFTSDQARDAALLSEDSQD